MADRDYMCTVEIYFAFLEVIGTCSTALRAICYSHRGADLKFRGNDHKEIKG